MKRPIRIALILLLFPPLLSVIAGWIGAPGFLHPEKRALTPDMVRDADVTFAQIGARREEFDVRGPDGVTLRGWKVRAATPNGAWVLVLHGVADNRYGVTGHARLLLQGGYNVVMMDSRAHGLSGGEIATYGWLEREDVSAEIDELEQTEHPEHLYALGISRGAESHCKPLHATRESKRRWQRLLLRRFRKRHMTMRDCNAGRCWAKRFSLRERGWSFIEVVIWRASSQAKFLQ